MQNSVVAAAPGTLPRAAAEAWPLWKRVLFRFAFVYWVLYVWPVRGQTSLIDLLPWNTEPLSSFLGWPLARLSHVVGVHLFHLQGEAADWHPTGSGDTAMNFCQQFCIAVLALLAGAVWSAFAEARVRRTGRPANYSTAYAWLRLVLRFTLGVTLLNYGFAKVFPMQFALAPGLAELNEPFGQASPMHILWFFMAVSRPYTIFGGLAEVVPGALLLFRRTSTLGLLGAVAVMTEVAVLNYTFDVPVKLYSTNLLLMALFLLLPDLQPMWAFFVQRAPARLSGVWVRKPERRALRIAAHVLQALLVLSCVYGVYDAWRSREMPHADSALQGVWTVNSTQPVPPDSAAMPATVVIDGTSLTLITPDGKRTRRRVQYQGDSLQVTSGKKDTALQWQRTGPREAHMTGTLLGKPAAFTLQRTDPETYELTSRGFHWVQESPYQR